MRTSKELVIDVEQGGSIKVCHLGTEVCFREGGMFILLSRNEPVFVIEHKGTGAKLGIAANSEADGRSGLFIWSHKGFTDCSNPDLSSVTFEVN